MAGCDVSGGGRVAEAGSGHIIRGAVRVSARLVDGSDQIRAVLPDADFLPVPVWDAARGCGGCGEESPLCSPRSGRSILMQAATIRDASGRVIVALMTAGRSRATIKRHEAEFNAFAELAWI